MLRRIYIAGVNRKHLAAAAEIVPAWLLSATLLSKYPSWVDQYMTRHRAVRWDPGTFSENEISYRNYREYLYRHAKPWHDYLQYDEIGDPEATSWYLADMRRRGMKPIPILHKEAYHLLKTEKHLAIGGIVGMTETHRRDYLDEIFYDNQPKGRIHLLGMMQHKWFSPYLAAVEGDSTSWIPRSDWNRRKSLDEWLTEYGSQWIEHQPREMYQMKLFA